MSSARHGDTPTIRVPLHSVYPHSRPNPRPGPKGAAPKGMLRGPGTGWHPLSTELVPLEGNEALFMRVMMAVPDGREEALAKAPVLSSSKALYELVKGSGNLANESLFVLVADNRMRFMGVVEFPGSGGGVCFRPVDVFQVITASGQPNFFLVHNHPSGDPAPSKEDIATTEAIAAVAKMLGVTLCDHVIVARPGGGGAPYYSFVDSGAMEVIKTQALRWASKIGDQLCAHQCSSHGGTGAPRAFGPPARRFGPPRR